MLEPLFASLAVAGALAAQPAFYIPSNTPGTGTCNVIPFGDAGSATWTNQVYQTIATAADLGSTPGLITGIAFAPCGTGVHTNTRLRVTLSHVPPAYVLSPTFATNLPSPVLVLDVSGYSLNIVANQWNNIGLQTAFQYDGVSDVVMEIIAEGNTNTGTNGMHRDVRPRAFAVNWSGTPPLSGSVDNAAAKWCLTRSDFAIPNNVPSVGTCNVIPWGDAGSATWSNQIYQTIATAADLGGAPCQITGISFAPCGTGIHRNSRVRITLSHVPPAYVLNPTFAANLPAPVVVLDTTMFAWNITANQWNDVYLQRGFAYDGVSDLVMEILAEGNTNTGTAGMHRDVRPRAFATGWTGSPPATGTVATGALKWRVRMGSASATPYGEGCLGLTHSYSGLPQLGAGTLDANINNCAASSPAFLVIGANGAAPFPIDLSFLGMVGCKLYQDILVVIGTVANGAGDAVVPLGGVANNPAFLGLRLLTQGANFNVAAPGSLTTSNFVVLVFGV